MYKKLLNSSKIRINQKNEKLKIKLFVEYYDKEWKLLEEIDSVSAYKVKIFGSEYKPGTHKNIERCKSKLKNIIENILALFKLKIKLELDSES